MNPHKIIRKIKEMNIAVKSLFFVVVTLVFVVLISFSILYVLFPKAYITSKLDDIETAVGSYVEEMEKSGSLTDEIKEEIGIFAIRYGADIKITSLEENEVILDIEESNAEFIRLQESGYLQEDRYYQGEKKFKKYIFEFYMGENKCTLQLDVYVQRIEDIEKIFLIISPYMAAICIMVAIIFAFLIAKKITSPINDISQKVKNMINYNYEINGENKKYIGNEIEKLDENVELLYKKLLDSQRDFGIEMEEKTKSEKMKYDFLRMASHELKTPLTAVNGMIEGMLYGIDPYTDKETYLKECQKVIYNMTDMIKDILNSTKNLVNEGKKTIVLDDVIYLMVSQYKTIMKAKELDVKITIPQNTCVKLQKDMFTKALDNVVSNAFKYGRNNGEIRIYYEKDELVIFNSCDILEKEEMSKVFEAFYRNNKKEDSGNGLGLFLTKRMFDMMEIDFEFAPSKDGKGMVFRMKIPTSH